MSAIRCQVRGGHESDDAGDDEDEGGRTAVVSQGIVLGPRRHRAQCNTRINDEATQSTEKLPSAIERVWRTSTPQ